MSKDQSAMQPDQGLGVATQQWEHGDPAQRVVSSRRRALERLRAAVRDGRPGPVLITGEPGAGKTWLAHRVIEGLPAGWQALSVEATSALDALEFLRLIGHSLGLTMTNRLGAARLMVKAALQNASTDGRHWLLIVDEAQRSSTAVWEEIQALVTCLGRLEGFAAMILLGQTELVRDLATRRLDALAACMSLHLHLMPLDLDEARELLGFHDRAGRSAEAALEELHRDALGNPARLLRLAAARSLALPSSAGGGARGRRFEAPESPRTSSARESRLVGRPAESIPAPVSAVPPEQAGLARAPSLIPSRPPIRFEDGLVEVGWEGDLEAELAHPDESATEPEAALPVEPDFNEELVEDRYAALQAWTEWTRNRERSTEIGTASGQPEPPFEAVADPETRFAREQPSDPARSTSVPVGSLRAETPHDFAPYSQLFTRLRQSEQS